MEPTDASKHVENLVKQIKDQQATAAAQAAEQAAVVVIKPRTIKFLPTCILLFGITELIVIIPSIILIKTPMASDATDKLFLQIRSSLMWGVLVLGILHVAYGIGVRKRLIHSPKIRMFLLILGIFIGFFTIISIPFVINIVFIQISPAVAPIFHTQ